MKKCEDFYNTLKDDPEAIIKWAEREILEYKGLIELVKKGMKLGEEEMEKAKKSR